MRLVFSLIALHGFTQSYADIGPSTYRYLAKDGRRDTYLVDVMFRVNEELYYGTKQTKVTFGTDVKPVLMPDGSFEGLGCRVMTLYFNGGSFEGVIKSLETDAVARFEGTVIGRFDTEGELYRQEEGFEAPEPSCQKVTGQRLASWTAVSKTSTKIRMRGDDLSFQTLYKQGVTTPVTVFRSDNQYLLQMADVKAFASKIDKHLFGALLKKSSHFGQYYRADAL